MKHLFIFSLTLVFIACKHDQATIECAKGILVTADVYETPNDLTKMLIDTSLCKKIVRMALSGQLNVYENYADLSPLSIEQIKEKIKPQVDTAFMEVPNDTITIEQVEPSNLILVPNGLPGKPKPTAMTFRVVTLDPVDNIKKIQFKEDWVFDPTNARITKKIIAYALCQTGYDEQQKEEVVKRLFWVKNE